MPFLRALTDRVTRRATALPCPSRPVCAIGDVHGRMDLLAAMLDRIAAQPDSDRARIVVLGDMIDRGPHSAAVLEHLHAAQAAAPARVICLMGNHERMMLDFITSPDAGAGWLRSGGDATVASYGLDPTDAPERLALALSKAIGPNIMCWLTQLPLSWCADGLLAVHAGADPAFPVNTQSETALLWGHPGFGRRPRKDGIWVMCGHVIVPEPRSGSGRIALDTGAWTTGVLSAGWLDASGLRFVQVSGPPGP